VRSGFGFFEFPKFGKSIARDTLKAMLISCLIVFKNQMNQYYPSPKKTI
jgi:hypothetical protein